MIHLVKSAALAFVLAIGTTGIAAAEEAKPATVAEPSDFSIGDPNAKVKIVEYASYTCPHCANFHATAFKPMKAEYIDTGKVYFTLREVYFDRYGLWAAMVARCGGDMRYFAIHDVLFDKQKEWAASDDPAAVINNLTTIAVSLGLEKPAVDACLKDAAMAEALVARFETNMKADEVEGTPTIFVNGTKYGSMGYEELKSIIDAELAK
jgi:protein-disulfide isomerase